MSHLVPCAGCARHVRATEPTCPFCGAASAAIAPTPRLPTQRLTRAARFAFGAAVVTTLNVAGCGNSHTPDDDAGHDAGLTSEPGLPTDAGDEPDAGADDAGTDVDAGMDAGNIAPPYGAPAEDAGDVPLPLYGGPPAD